MYTHIVKRLHQSVLIFVVYPKKDKYALKKV